MTRPVRAWGALVAVVGIVAMVGAAATDAPVFEHMAAIFGSGRGGKNCEIAVEAGDYSRIERDAQRGIGYDPEQRAAAFQTSPIGQQAVIRQDGSDAGEYRVRIMPDLLYMRSRPLAPSDSDLDEWSSRLAISA